MFQSSFHIQFPERNSSLKHYRMLCCSNRAYPVNADTHYM